MSYYVQQSCRTEDWQRNEKAVLSQGNRATPLYVSIKTECAGSLFRLVILLAVDMAALMCLSNFMNVCHKNLNLV